MKLNPFFKPDPESLYQNDVGLFLKHIRETRQPAGSLLHRIARRISDLDYKNLAFDEKTREDLIFKAIKHLLIDLDANKDIGLFGKSLSVFEGFFNAKYLKREFYNHYYKTDFDALYEGLITKDGVAWDVLIEMVSRKVSRLDIFKNVKDKDEQKEIFQIATAEFLEKIFADKFRMEEANHSFSSMISYFSTIAYRRSADYFRNLKKFKGYDPDQLEDWDSDDFESEPKSGSPQEFENDDFMTDSILTFESVTDKGKDEVNGDDEEKIGVIMTGSVVQWTKQALADCLNRLHEADVESAKDGNREIRHWRKLVEMKGAEGKSHNTIADELKITPSNSQNRLAKAIKLLRDCMISKGIYHS